MCGLDHEEAPIGLRKEIIGLQARSTMPRKYLEEEDMIDLQRRIDKAEEQLHRSDTAFRIVKWLVGIVLVTTMGSLLTLAYKIYDEGYEHGALANRVQQLEHNLDQLDHELDHLKERRP